MASLEILNEAADVRNVTLYFAHNIFGVLFHNIRKQGIAKILAILSAIFGFRFRLGHTKWPMQSNTSSEMQKLLSVISVLA